MEDLKNQSGISSNDSNGLDDMDSFAEQCERRLKEEHERIAAEKKAEATPTTLDDGEKQKSNQSAEVPKELGVEQNKPSEQTISYAVQNENERKPENDLYPAPVAETPSAAVVAEDELYQSEDEPLPLLLRVLFSIILAVLGAAGMWMIISDTSDSYFLDILCFFEVAMCLITSVGINASGIAGRKQKMIIMRTALWFVFLFYCLYTADTLFLHRAIETKFIIADFAEYARTHISFDLTGELAKMSGWGIAESAFYVIPYAFCVPVLMKSYRNIILYFLYMTFSFFAVSTLRIVTMTGGASLAQCLVCLIGAAVTYIVVMLPPVQDMLRKVGLLEWVELKDDED